MSIESAWRLWNLRYFERILAVVLIVIFLSVFINRAERIDAALERATLELVVQDLQSRVLMFAAEQRILGREQALVDYIGANPVGLVIDRIGNYAGAFDTVDWDAVAPGQWVFVRPSGNLVYRVINEDFVQTQLSDPKRIRYRLDAFYRDRNNNQRFDAGTDLFVTLRFAAVDEDPWRIEH